MDEFQIPLYDQLCERDADYYAVDYLALQLKARMEGIDTPVYGLQEVHHTS